ncbi:uncharacterized protein LOC141912157 [Tubulanus polymorphus]|uniref:uncharacterized protein LOC141912157 n=1 Tax=Tubulanus polymorphus TaxID=672921 RepID=UPI003DA61FA9
MAELKVVGADYFQEINESDVFTDQVLTEEILDEFIIEIQDETEGELDQMAENICSQSKQERNISNEDSSTDSDMDIDEIYRKSSRAAAHGNTHHKKNKRVYDNYHACLYCGKLVQHIGVHMKTHADVEEVQHLLKNCDTPGKWEDIRKRGDDRHNRAVIEAENGEIILARRPSDNFLDISRYGPCPHCRAWIVLQSIKYHYRRCTRKLRKSGKLSQIKKRDLIIQSQMMAGHIKLKPSKLMLDEVFSIMTQDDIGRIAQNDRLILVLGESWLRRNFENVDKRKYYASQRMRLAARFLINLRAAVNKENSPDEPEEYKQEELWELLLPKNFDAVVLAAIKTCSPYMDDEDDLMSPSNAFKLKYDLKRLINAKWATLVKQEGNDRELAECKAFLGLMDIEWAEKLTKFAQYVLMKRRYESKTELPSPDDIEKLSRYLDRKLKDIDLIIDNFPEIIKLVQAKLLHFNRRRSGELEVIKLQSFLNRETSLSDIDNSVASELTDIERQLLITHSLMRVRGKRSKIVPVLIPPHVLKPLEFIASLENRCAAGICVENKYLFPTTGKAYVRAYSSLKSICEICNLKAPARITSVTIRKYTATLTQMMNLDKHHFGWVCKHLGHTKRVNIEHYQAMSGLIERVYLTKLFLLQDLNLTKKYEGQDLSQIDIKEIVTSNITRDDNRKEIENAHLPSLNDHEINDSADIDADEAVAFGGNEDEDDDDQDDRDSNDSEQLQEPVNLKKGVNRKSTRQKWSLKELNEIKKYFIKYLESGITPNTFACEKAKKLSKANNGELHLRQSHLIVKKISNMNVTKRQSLKNKK